MPETIRILPCPAGSLHICLRDGGTKSGVGFIPAGSPNMIPDCKLIGGIPVGSHSTDGAALSEFHIRGVKRRYLLAADAK